MKRVGKKRIEIEIEKKGRRERDGEREGGRGRGRIAVMQRNTKFVWKLETSSTKGVILYGGLILFGTICVVF